MTIFTEEHVGKFKTSVVSARSAALERGEKITRRGDQFYHLALDYAIKYIEGAGRKPISEVALAHLITLGVIRLDGTIDVDALIDKVLLSKRGMYLLVHDKSYNWYTLPETVMTEGNLNAIINGTEEDPSDEPEPEPKPRAKPVPKPKPKPEPEPEPEPEDGDSPFKALEDMVEDVCKDDDPVIEPEPEPKAKPLQKIRKVLRKVADKAKAWKKVEFDSERDRLLLSNIRCNKNPLLCGPAGTGKTTVIYLVCEALHRRLYSLGSIAQKYEICNYVGTEGIVHTTITQALLDMWLYKVCGVPLVDDEGRECTGIVILLDEFDGSDPNAVLPLNELLANRRMLIYDYERNKDGDLIEDESGHLIVTTRTIDFSSWDVTIVATANTAGRGGSDVYTGRLQMDAATLSRFSCMEWNNNTDMMLRLAQGDQALVDFALAVEKGARDKGATIYLDNRDLRTVKDLTKDGISMKTIFANHFKIKVFNCDLRAAVDVAETLDKRNTYSKAFYDMVAEWRLSEGQ